MKWMTMTMTIKMTKIMTMTNTMMTFTREIWLSGPRTLFGREQRESHKGCCHFFTKFSNFTFHHFWRRKKSFSQIFFNILNILNNHSHKFETHIEEDSWKHVLLFREQIVASWFRKVVWKCDGRRGASWHWERQNCSRKWRRFHSHSHSHSDSHSHSYSNQNLSLFSRICSAVAETVSEYIDWRLKTPNSFNLPDSSINKQSVNCHSLWYIFSCLAS